MKNQVKKEYMSNYQDFTALENPRGLGDLVDHSTVRRGRATRFSGDAEAVKLGLEHLGVCLSVGCPWLGLQAVKSKVLFVSADGRGLRERVNEAVRHIAETREYPGAARTYESVSLTPKPGWLFLGTGDTWGAVEAAITAAGGPRVLDVVILCGLDAKEIKAAAEWCKVHRIALVSNSGWSDCTVKFRQRTDGLLDCTISAGKTPVAFCVRSTGSDIYRDEPEQ